MDTGILQYFVPEASDADHHTWSKGENSAHCEESGLHQKGPLQAEFPGGILSTQAF